VELCGILFGILVAVLLVACVGHAIWLVLAALGRAIRGEPAAVSSPAAWDECPGCGEPVPPLRRRCPACGLAVNGGRAAQLRDLAATIRQLERFHEDGTLDAGTIERLRRGCRDERQRLLRPPLPARPRPAKEVREEELPEVLPVEEAPTSPPRVVQVARLHTPRASVPPAPPAPAPPAAPPPEPAAPPPAAPTRPRRTLGEVFGAFMEEKNILWGELVGGLLIVGCSVALVISLWERLEAIPYFPFLIFAGITAALFGAGLYTLHHWKLESTSRGLLVIALLLVPLNFVVLAGLSAGRVGDLLEVGTEVAALAVFAGLVMLAARVIVPERPRWLALGVIGPAAGTLLVPRLLTPGEVGAAPFLLLGWAPVACHLLACGGAIVPSGRRPHQSERSARGLLALLGLASFALAAALGFLVYRGGDIPTALRQLALPVALSGVPILLGGLLVYSPLTPGPSPLSTEERGEEAISPILRTAGSAVGLAGMGAMLAATLLAWPEPGLLIAVCALDFAVLTAVALMARLPIAHAAATPCLAVASLTGFHLLGGHLDVPLPEMAAHLMRLAASPASGSALAVLVVGMAAASEFFARRGRAPDAVAYLAAAVAVSLVSLVLVFLGGADQPGRAALVCGAYAATALALNLRWRRAWLAYGGLALVVLATLWGVHEGGVIAAPVRALIVAVESLLAACLAVMASRTTRAEGDPTVTGYLRSAWTSIPAGAWRDAAAAAALAALGLAALAPGFPDGELHAVTVALLALTACALAWLYRWVPLTWAGAVLLLAAVLHALLVTFHQPAAALTFVAALLTHATVTLAIGTAFRRGAPAAQHLRHLLAEPLVQCGFLATASAAFLLPFGLGWGALGAAALYAGWLAALWLLVSGERRLPELFSLGQVVVAIAVLLGVSSWLEGREWVARSIDGLADPRSLHAYGIALAGVSLVWMAARHGLRRNEAAQALLEPPWPAVDRVLLAAVVLGQLALAVAGALPGAAAELMPPDAPAANWPAALSHAYGPSAWALLLAVALVLAAALWQRPWAATLGLLLAAVTVPVLAAGAFADQHAVASALRWGLAGCFLAASAPLRLRGRLLPFAAALRIPQPAESIFPWGRRLLVGLAVAPVLLLTLIVAIVGFAGSATAGPDAGSFFGRVGWVTSNVLPLVLVSAGLVGYAVRDRLPGYAFAAGLVADVALMGGYALHVVLSGAKLDGATWARVIQLGTIGAAVWAMAWLLGRGVRSAGARGNEGDSFLPLRAYMEAQLGLAALGNAVLLGLALVLLTLAPHGAAAGWVHEAGMPLGWLALAITVSAFAVAVRRPAVANLGSWVRTPSLIPHALSLVGLAAAGLLACGVERLAPGWGYRTLMLAWAGSALAWVAILGVLARLPNRDGEAITLGLSDVAATWAAVAGVLTLLLGLKAAFVHDDPLWAAVAIGLASTAGAGIAVQRRQEGFAFVAGLGINLAASLLVWHFYGRVPFESWGVLLLQANAAASAGVALLWLWWRRQVYGPTELRVAVVPLLGVQVALSLAANAVLALLPLCALAFEPGRPLTAALIRTGDAGGWAALVLATVAAAVYFGRTLPRGRLPLAVLTALAACILAACVAGRWDTGNWLSYHVLLAGWTAVSLAVPAAGITAASLLPDRRDVRHWAAGAGAALVALAVRGAWADPARPYWAGAAALSVALSMGAVALWSRHPGYVYASGLLVNLVGFLAWLAWGTDTTANFLATQALCFALTAGFWSALKTALRAGKSPIDLRGRAVPFSHAAVTLALVLLGAIVAPELAAHLAGASPARDFLPWGALVATVAALAILHWDDRAILAPAGLYSAGLLAVGLALARLPVAPARVAWAACLLLAGYTLLAAVVVRAAPRRVGPWYLPAQGIVAALTLLLSVGVIIGFDSAADRLAGPLAVALVGAAAFLLEKRGPALPLRYLTLTLGVVLLTELGWAALDLTVPALTLHRNVVLMIALAVATVAYGAGLARAEARWPEWAACGRRCGPVLGVLALLVLLVVLGQEFLLFNPDPAVKRTPMLGWAVAVVIAALCGLIAAQLRFALRPDHDPFGLPERRRSLYVYLAEFLLVGLFLHVRLNVPWVFGSNFIHYWVFAVMAIAFLGVGLAEICQRRNLPVLAGPLQRTGMLLPLLPLLAFWVRPPDWVQDFLKSRLPGTEPLLAALNKLPTYHTGQFDRYALVWLLLGVLYLVVALIRRSSRYALLAALAANVGLWCLLYHHGWAFLVHPQLWLVPLALIVLVSEHLNRERLGPAASATLRYTGLGLLYLSSTADMFIAGLGRSAVLPLVLALFSVAGVFAGILLRVRAFLLLGVGFLGLVVFSMIWHAAVDLSQTWVWWASGIVLGVAILGLFALFEKRRNDVLGLVERMKEWD
jgi:hypothetical protein